MEKVRTWCGQPSDEGWLRKIAKEQNRTEQQHTISSSALMLLLVHQYQI